MSGIEGYLRLICPNLSYFEVLEKILNRKLSIFGCKI